MGVIPFLAACNQEAANVPVSTAAPATVSLADFQGEWTGKSLAGANLRVIVQGDRVGYEYNNVPAGVEKPQFIGNKMRVPFASGGWIEVSKKSATELSWEYPGNNPASANKSWATLTKVK